MSKPIEVLSAVHGIAPRSDELLQLGGDVERGRAPLDEFAERLKQERNDWLDLQTEAGIDLRADARLHWQDNVRAIVQHTEGFEAGINEAPVTRWLHTNTFYRKPIIVDWLTINAESFLHELKTPDGYIDLVAPHSFAELCESDTEHDISENVLNLYRQILSSCTQEDIQRILLKEYTYTNLAGLLAHDKGLDQVAELASEFPELQIAYILPATPDIRLLSRWPENLALGLNTETFRSIQRCHPYNFVPIQGKEVWQQIIPGDSTLQTKIEVAKWPKNLPNAIQPARLVLTHTLDLEHVPLPYAQDKVKLLGETAALLREHIQGGDNE